MKLTINGRSYEVEVQPDAVVVDGVAYKTTVVHDNGETTVRVAGRPYKVKVKDEKSVVVDGRPLTVELSGRSSAPRPVAKAGPPASAKKNGGNGADHGPGNGAENGAVRALMPGTVTSVRVQPGDRVDPGAVLLILEAMKMQNEIKAPHAGVVKRIAVAAGQTVNNGDVMVVLSEQA
ncbi:MAG: biotin/lipoyl-containing protein [Nitrososphaerales archaeon]